LYFFDEQETFAMTDQGPEEIDSSVVLANKYQIVGKIGSGSFGEIFLAKNMRSGEDVAVKVENHTIDKSTSGKTRVLKSQLKREAKIYANLFDEGMFLDGG
jgi:serine/threonine protein kinase